jgi:hypothetical protein
MNYYSTVIPCQKLNQIRTILQHVAKLNQGKEYQVQTKLKKKQLGINQCKGGLILAIPPLQCSRPKNRLLNDQWV